VVEENLARADAIRDAARGGGNPISRIMTETEVAKAGVPREAFKAWATADQKAVLDVIADTIAKEHGGRPRNLAYFPHISDAPNAGKYATFFGSVWDSLRKKTRAPNFSRAFTGSQNYSRNVEQAWAVRNAEHAKFIADRRVVAGLMKDALPWDGSPSGLLPGHHVFAPGPAMTLRKMSMELADDALNIIVKKEPLIGMGILDNPEVINFLSQKLAEQTENLARFGKVRLEGPAISEGLYQIPSSMVRKLQKSIGSNMSPTLKLFWDSPMNFWRTTVLALSPRWIIYNMLGNTVLNTLAGVGPRSYMNLVKYGTKVLPDEVRMGFMATEGRVAHLGAAVDESVAGQALQLYRDSKFHRGLTWLPSKVAEINSQIETFFRGANYMSEAVKQAKMELVREGVGTFHMTADLMRAKLAEIARNPVKTAAIMQKVNDFLFDYGNMNGFERSVIRRFIVPFWSWNKNIIRLTVWTLPFKYPGRTALLRGLATMGYDQLMDSYRQNGIDPNTVPEWFRGNIPTELQPDGSVLFWNPRGANPFMTLTQTALSMLSPPIKIALERMLGEDLFTGRKFTDPTVIDSGRGQVRYNPQTGQFREAKVKPPLLSHLLRQFPQYDLLRKTFTPYREYDTGTLLHPQPLPGARRVRLSDKLWGYSGVPHGEYTPPEPGANDQQRRRQLSLMYKQLSAQNRND
jgi:hypothetical protein